MTTSALTLFAAIKPTPRVIERLSRLQRGVAGAKWSAPEKLHVTLAYFGPVEPDYIEILDRELARPASHSLNLSVKGVGHFGKTPHSIWAGIEKTPDLLTLHNHCKAAARRAKVTLEARDYTPHITLAYLRQPPRIDRVIAFEQRLAMLKLKPFIADSFSLYSSHARKSGPNIYREEARYPLLGPDYEAHSDGIEETRAQLDEFETLFADRISPSS